MPSHDHPTHAATAAPIRSSGVLVLLMVLFGCRLCHAGSLLQDAVDPSPRIAEDLFRSQSQLPGIQRGGWKHSPVLSSIRPGQLLNSEASLPGELLIHGTGGRNNPFRRELAQPLRNQPFFIRFQLCYAPQPADATSIDPEFFVLWLDRNDGGDTAVHSTNVPNIGLHVADRGPLQGQNVFMIRIGSSNVAWTSTAVKPGKTYTLVAALDKRSTASTRYDQLRLWIDPTPDTLPTPDAQISAAGPDLIRWAGFATGLKTEPTDEIRVSNLVLSRTWKDALDFSTDGSIPLRNSDGSPVDPMLANHRNVSFRTDVFPLLRQHCFDCHSSAEPRSGLRLDLREEILGYSTGLPMAVPGYSAGSRMIEVLREESRELRMPPADHAPALTKEQILLLAAWINQGLSWDDQLLPPAPRRTSDHWAFQPVRRPHLPQINSTEWVRTPIDAFIAAAHEQHQLTPSAEADTESLARRLALTITGLPPKPEQLTTLLQPDGTAWQNYTEQLLNSPHYGEHWGRHWLDLARWAESHGHQHDLPRPFAWRYRDYVIDCFNDDMPWNQFITEQIAGDEILPINDRQLIATGFLAAARISGNEMNKAIQRNEMLVDIVNTTSAALLGLTVECAQCHNHKTDPISQRDYYRLQAFFASGQPGNLALQQADSFPAEQASEWMPKATYSFYKSEADKLVRRRMFAHTPQPHTWGFCSATAAQQGVERLPVVNRDPLPWQPSASLSQQTRLLIRGDTGSPGPIVRTGWPEVLGPLTDSQRLLTRIDLARWLTSPENPLVARVWVNRIWQHHFGRGLVETSSDFGPAGSAPSHPELLDWLAVELMENNWSTRHIQRLIVNSATFRQSAEFDRSDADIDPSNQLLHRWSIRRLEAESIRDSILAVTGELSTNPVLGSVPPQTEEQLLQRTVYLYQRRSEMPEVMRLFDAPDLIGSCSRRDVSTVAQQPLFLLNSDFMQNRSRALAALIQQQAGPDSRQQILAAFERILGRQPTDSELFRSEQYLLKSRGADDDEQLRRFCQAMFSLNEFLYVP